MTVDICVFVDVMLDLLPAELFINLYEYLPLSEWYKLRRLNRSIYSKIHDIEKYVLTKQLKFCKPIFSKDDLYSWIDMFCDNFYFAYKRGVSQIFTNNENLGPIESKTVKQLAIEQCQAFTVSYNLFLNFLFRKIFHYYLLNGSIQKYDNQVELYIFRILLSIQSKDMTLFRDNLLFSKNLSSSCHRLLQEYVYCALMNYNESTQIIPFDILYEMSRYCITLGMFKKLMGIKPLDLSQSMLVVLPQEEMFIEEIVINKAQLCDDDVISFNYSQLRTILANQSLKCYNQLVDVENREIERHVYLKDPFTRTKVNFGSIQYKTMMKRIVNTGAFYLKQRTEYHVYQQKQKYSKLLFDV